MSADREKPDAGFFRKTVVTKLIPYAKKDPRIVLLVCDMGFGAIDEFKKEFPRRIFNAGIMEQGTVGIAAGMSLSGMVPVVYSIVNFLAFRAIEQIRNDVLVQKLNVKFIATGVNNYFRFLGPSHCCGEDDKKIMEVVGMPVFDPYEKPGDYPQLVERWITSPSAGYFRV
jgi:Transketolase, C-terminal subunit